MLVCDTRRQYHIILQLQATLTSRFIYFGFEGDFQCDSRCVRRERLCDGRPDCNNKMDEDYSVCASRPCDKRTWKPLKSFYCLLHVSVLFLLFYAIRFI